MTLVGVAGAGEAVAGCAFDSGYWPVVESGFGIGFVAGWRVIIGIGEGYRAAGLVAIGVRL
jgi:hypothetical protein